MAERLTHATRRNDERSAERKMRNVAIGIALTALAIAALLLCRHFQLPPFSL